MENFQILARGLYRRCPQCGVGKMFTSWAQLAPACLHCGLQISSREPDTWAFMYISTAFITGLFILAMLWAVPSHLWAGRILVACVALVFYLLTWPFRKGFAIALDYLVELRWNNEFGLRFRPDTKK